MTNELVKGDDVTVVIKDRRLLRARVEAVYTSQFIIWPSTSDDGDGQIRTYITADEGITWVRGFHERGASELASLLAYITMR